MELTLALAIVALVNAAMTWLTAMTHKTTLTRWTINTAWVGVAAGFAGIYLEHTPGVAAAIATAALAAIAALPAAIDALEIKTPSVAIGSIPGLILGAIATSLAANSLDTTPYLDQNMILFAGQWASLAVVLTLVFSAIGATSASSGRPSLTGAALLTSSLSGAALLLGASRTSIPEFAYSIALYSDGKPVKWALPAVTGNAPNFSFDVTLPIAGAHHLLITAATIAVLAGIVSALKPRVSASTWLLGFAGLCAALAAGSVVSAGMSASLPEAGAYLEHAIELGLNNGIPERILDLGGFVHGDTLSVRWVDILADLGLLGAAALTALTAARFSFGGASNSSAQTKPTIESTKRTWPVDVEDLGALWGRDLVLRAASINWLVWILALLTNWRVHATYGYASASEWVALGAAISLSGLCVFSWRLGHEARRIVFALMGAIIILTTTLSFALGGLFGVALH